MAIALVLTVAGVVARAGLPPLIPREVLFGNPDKAKPRIAPNGQLLAYLAPVNGVLNVWVRTVGTEDDKPVTRGAERGIQRYFWAPNSSQILFIQDKDGDENSHLYSVDVSTQAVRDLTPIEGIRVKIVAVSRLVPDAILVGINDRDPAYHDVYRLDLASGRLDLVEKNEGNFLAFEADPSLKLRGALRLLPDGGMEHMTRDGIGSPWRRVIQWLPADVLNSGPLGFTADGKSLHVLSSSGSNTSELRRVDLATGVETTLASDQHVDVVDFLIDPLTIEVQAVALNRERLHWQVLDRSIKTDFRVLGRLRRGDFRVIDRDFADRTWIVSYTVDSAPTYYYAYDRSTREAKLLFSNRGALEGLRLAKMFPISYRARDGLLIHGYLTMPRGVKARRLPMVVVVHNGPWSRDSWGYDGVAQWLANRGYAVLQVNYRGSTGYGKAFLNAADRDWGGKMQDDLADGVRWAIEKGIADPKRVGILGDSYGGYATLVALSKTPDLYRCGVDMYGITNLVTFMENIPPTLKFAESLLWERVGHPVRDEVMLKERSPINHVDKIIKPLLIAQGANDSRVKKAESVKMVEALRRAGKTVEYVEYPDEGHGFTKPKNRLDFFARAEKFLSKHLGGRSED